MQSPDSNQPRVCSFCQKGEEDGRKLIAPPSAPQTFICAFCLRAANLHLEQDRAEEVTQKNPKGSTLIQ